LERLQFRGTWSAAETWAVGEATSPGFTAHPFDVELFDVEGSQLDSKGRRQQLVDSKA